MKLTKDVIEFHKKCLVVDLHVDTLLLHRLFGYKLTRKHITYLPKGIFCFHGDAPRFRIGNVGAVFLGLVPKPFGKNGKHIDKMIDVAEVTCQQAPHLCTMARSAEDITKARAENKTAFLLGIEGATALDGDPRRLRYFAKRGVRYFGFVHFNANFAATPGVGSGRKGVNASQGLSKHGELIVDECVRNGVIMDLAHASREAFYKVIDLVPEKIPVIVSHCGVRRIKNTRRNLDEDQISAVANTGGVIGIMNTSIFIGGKTMDDYIQHVLAVRDIAGYRHVAIGSDFDGFIFPMKHFEDMTKFPVLTQYLLDAGLPKQEVAAILGENALRVIKEIPPRYFGTRIDPLD
ncbi:MAG: dipeptidase [Candidatus Hodarchaeota archaeon]